MNHEQFDFGMIGIGVMGSNLLLNMADHGFAVVGFDLKQERADQLVAAARKRYRGKRHHQPFRNGIGAEKAEEDHDAGAGGQTG